MSVAPKIALEAQIRVVAESESFARLGAETHGDAAVAARADALGAARRTLEWLRDHRAAVRAAAAAMATPAAHHQELAEDQQGPPERTAARRRYADLPLSQQAALRCADPRFQRFLRVDDADGAARAVRGVCRVASRRELDSVDAAGAAWRSLDAEYVAWLSCATLEENG